MTTYTSSLGLEEITPGSQAGLWGNTTNNNLALIDQAIAGVTTITLDGASGTTTTLTNYSGALNQARSAVIVCTYTSTQATGSNTIVIPSTQKLYVFNNSSGQPVIVQTAAAAVNVTIPNGNATLVYCDGVNAYPGIASASVGTLTVSGGGTGVTSFGAGGFIVSTGGTANLSTLAAIPLNTTAVTGTLPVVNGGTGVNSITSGAIMVGNGTGNVAALVGGTVGYVPTWNGSAWYASAPPGGVSSVTATSPITYSGTSSVVIGMATSSGAGSYTYPSNIQVDNWGRVTSVTSGSSSSGVTQVNTSGNVNGITLTGGPITGVGTISLGGSLSNVNLASQVTGTLPVANGGTGYSNPPMLKVYNFTATNTAASGTNCYIVYDTIGFNTATGYYNTSTGVFTAPVGGYYQVTATATINGVAGTPNASSWAGIGINATLSGTTALYDFNVIPLYNQGGSVVTPVCTAIVKMFAGDSVQALFLQNTGVSQVLSNTNSSSTTMFIGFMRGL